MEKYITITYTINNVRVALTADASDDAFPYTLAQMFVKVMADTEVNPSMVIDTMKDEVEYES